MDKQREEEAKILHSIQETRALMSVGELAKGVVYSESLKTGWRPPRYIREASQSKHERIRKKMHILTDGEDVSPPIKTFKVRGTPTLVHSLIPRPCVMQHGNETTLSRPTESLLHLTWWCIICDYMGVWTFIAVLFILKEQVFLS